MHPCYDRLNFTILFLFLILSMNSFTSFALLLMVVVLYCFRFFLHPLSDSLIHFFLISKSSTNEVFHTIPALAIFYVFACY